MEDLVTVLALAIVIAIAARTDLVTHRIPNVLTVAAVVLGLLTQVVFGGLDGLLRSIAGVAVGLACLLPLYLGKGMGAGDVKLMGAVGSFLGPMGALLAAVLTLVAGACLAVAVVVRRVAASRGSAPGVRMSGVRAERFPYAIAIGIGTAASLWFQGTLVAAIAALRSV